MTPARLTSRKPASRTRAATSHNCVRASSRAESKRVISSRFIVTASDARRRTLRIDESMINSPFPLEITCLNLSVSVVTAISR